MINAVRKPKGATMEQLHETARNLTNLLACRALSIMADRAGTTAETVLATITADPQGKTANYFRDLMHVGIQAAQDHHMLTALAA